MFCPANEAFQNITEKTKLIAQKCSHQIRIAAAATLSPQQQQQDETKKTQTTLEVPQQQQSQAHYMSISLPTSPAGFKNFIDIDNIDGNISSYNRIGVVGGSSNDILDDNKYDINEQQQQQQQQHFLSSDINFRENNKNNLNEPYWKRRTSDTNVNSNSNNGNCIIQGTQSLSKASTTKLGSNFNKYFYSCTSGTLRNLAKKYQQQKNANSNNQTQSSTVTWYVKPTWRYWGEEREKDVIFSVYLKKVRYHRPTMITNEDSDDEISHLEWETVRVRFVKAATLPRLVEALATDDGELESTFINVFLSTYRTFSNAKEILELLIKRYDALTELILRIKDRQINNHSSSSASSISSSSINSHNNPFHLHNQNGDDTHIDPNDDSEDILVKHEQHKKTLVSALHVWLDGFPEDWNEENLRHLLTFSSKRLPNSELHMKVLHRYERCIRLQAQQNHHHHHHHHHHHNEMGNNGGSISSGSNSTLPWTEQSYPDLHFQIAEQFSGLCLAPAFRGPPSHLLQAYRFPHIPIKHFAEQLTRMDMELFKRLIPHQCLAATWSKRNKHEADTVVATVNQFNAVSYRVVSSILIEPKLKPQERAVNISTWIEIAQELRLLKNFSSLKAIISSLQSNPIFRLKKTWNALPKEKQELFEELARISSKDMSDILIREGTAKCVNTVDENDKQLAKALQKQDIHTSHGTIPYLGAFLSDLTYTDSFYPDYIDDHLINFSKRRKEFESLATIKLLQGAANTYNLREDHHFDRWFASMLVLDEHEAHALSYQIEQPSEPLRKMNNNNNNSNNNNNHNNNHSTPTSTGHRKTDSITSNSSSGAGSNTFISNFISITDSNYSRSNSLDRDTNPPNTSASSSVSNLSIDSSHSGGQKTPYNKLKNKPNVLNDKSKKSSTDDLINDGKPIINAQLVQSPGQKNTTPDFYIIRVTLEVDNIEEIDGVILYKSIMLGNNEHTPQVIKNALMKLDIEGDADQFTLAQVLPDKELVMPVNANVYYAVNTQYNLNFILRRKKNIEK